MKRVCTLFLFLIIFACTHSANQENIRQQTRDKNETDTLVPKKNEYPISAEYKTEGPQDTML